MSGMSAGSVSSQWYTLTVSGGISIMPAEGSEDEVYSSLREEGDEFEKCLVPHQQQIEKIVLEAKKKFNAPIVASADGVSVEDIAGAIIEDVMEFDPALLPDDYTEQDRQETIEYENSQYDRRKEEEHFMELHFTQYFEPGTILEAQFKVDLPNLNPNYTMRLLVENRINRSVLNWIRDQVTPIVAGALRRD